MKEKKRNLRKEILAKRDSLPAREREQKSRAICDKFFMLEKVTKAKHFFVYYSIKSEVDTKCIIETLLGENKTVALPRITDSGFEMTLHKISSLDDLVPGKLSFPEPPPELPQIKPEQIEIAVIPGVAFDTLKWRLGWGGGYYDRFLSSSHSFSVGLAFEIQLVGELPTELHDQPLDTIITEKRIIS